MKYFVGTINEMINGFDTSSKQVVKADDEKQANAVLDNLARTWRDEDGGDEEENGYSFDGGGILVRVGRMVEVTEDEYKVLVKYL